MRRDAQTFWITLYTKGPMRCLCQGCHNGTRLEPCAPEPIVHFLADVLCQGLIIVAAVDNANANSAGLR